jgi:hypothetical protein
MPTSHTPHRADCRRVFHRLDADCQRCQELAAGAPRRPWHGTRRAEQERQRIEAIRAHDCRKARCGPICTAFDW